MDFREQFYKDFDYESKMTDLIEKRKASGMTQKDVAVALNVTESTISLIEHFKRRSMVIYYQYCNLFGGGTK